jgi:uncharacterized protein (TIGR00369 family)
MDEASARRLFEAALANQVPQFETFFLAQFFGLQFDYPEDTCVIRFPVHDFMYNPQGSLHGGVIAFIADISMGHLLRKTTGTAGTTLEMKLQYLGPILAPHGRCEGRFLRRGRTISFMQSRLWDADDRLAVVATSTWMQARPAAKAGDAPAGAA